MNMHYAGDVPDWELTTAAERNAWQQLAAGTRGIATPANVISLAGFGLVLWVLLVMVQGQLGYGTLLLVENLGEFALLYVDCGDPNEPIIAKLEGTVDMPRGAPVRLAASTESLHCFDDTGRAFPRKD